MNKKRIAFGWSGTLIPEVGEFRCIPARGLGALVYKPHLRQGTLELMKSLQRGGWEIWLYTLGPLPKQRVTLYFALNGVQLGGVLTGKEHQHAYQLGKAPHPNLKHAPAFDLTLIADDKESTQQAGRAYGFDTLHVTTCHADWTLPIRQRCLAPQQSDKPHALAA